MNLIEQLGGYEKAKSIYKNRPQTSTHHFNDKYYENWNLGKWVRFDGDQCVDCKKPDSGSVNLGILGLMLLDYRRQHNIFEVGDKVVCKYEHAHLFGDVVLEIAYFRDDLKELGRFVRFTNGNDFKLDAIRHATDAEIKAGKRLEVKSDS